MSSRVADRLADDSNKRFARGCRYLDALLELQSQPDAYAAGHILRRLRDRGVERLVERPRQRRDRAARLVECALGRHDKRIHVPGLLYAPREPARLRGDE